MSIGTYTNTYTSIGTTPLSMISNRALVTGTVEQGCEKAQRAHWLLLPVFVNLLISEWYKEMAIELLISGVQFHLPALTCQILVTFSPGF